MFLIFVDYYLIPSKLGKPSLNSGFATKHFPGVEISMFDSNQENVIPKWCYIVNDLTDNKLNLDVKLNCVIVLRVSFTT